MSERLFPFPSTLRAEGPLSGSSSRPLTPTIALGSLFLRKEINNRTEGGPHSRCICIFSIQALLCSYSVENLDVCCTRDFRWEPMSERARLGKKVLDALGGNIVDALYLDSTYCIPSMSFPPRDVAAQQVVDIISLHPDIVICLDSLGDEELFLYILRALSTKIWVWLERLKTMHLLGYEDIFTTKTCHTRVRAVPRYSLTPAALELLNTVHPTIGIMPTGLPWGHWESLSYDKCDHTLDSSLYCRKFDLSSKDVPSCAYSVPYSEHSCFNEILDFIKIIRPSKITGIVSLSFCHISHRQYFENLCGLNYIS